MLSHQTGLMVCVCASVCVWCQTVGDELGFGAELFIFLSTGHGAQWVYNAHQHTAVLNLTRQCQKAIMASTDDAAHMADETFLKLYLVSGVNSLFKGGLGQNEQTAHPRPQLCNPT